MQSKGGPRGGYLAEGGKGAQEDDRVVARGPEKEDGMSLIALTLDFLLCFFPYFEKVQGRSRDRIH